MRNVVSSRVQTIGESAIRVMMMAAQRIPGALSLAQGTPDTRTPAYIRDGVIKLLRENEAIGKYSLAPGLPELRKEVARRLGEKGNFAVDFERNVCITAGAVEALAIAISTLVDAGDEVLIPDPGYPPYTEQVAFAGGTPVYFSLQSENAWSVDIEKLESLITPRTKALVLSNPSNPTGMITGKAEVEAIVRLAEKHDFFIIADPTYEFLVYDGAALPSFLPYESLRDHLLVCHSFSKEFSMTGWRVGYLYAPAYILEQAQKVHDSFVLCAPTISQFAAHVALTQKPGEDPEGMRASLSKKRETMCRRLDGSSDLFSYTKPQGAFYILARYKKSELDSRSFALKMLEEAKVICVPGAGFGPSGEGHVRFSYCTSEANINEAFDRIERWNKSL